MRVQLPRSLVKQGSRGYSQQPGLFGPFRMIVHRNAMNERIDPHVLHSSLFGPIESCCCVVQVDRKVEISLLLAEVSKSGSGDVIMLLPCLDPGPEMCEGPSKALAHDGLAEQVCEVIAGPKVVGKGFLSRELDGSGNVQLGAVGIKVAAGGGCISAVGVIVLIDG